MLTYYSYIEEPSIDRLSLDYSPRAGLDVSVVSFWFQATGESGAHYNLVRAVGMPQLGSVMNMGLYRGSDDIDTRSEFAIPFREHPVVETCWTERRDATVVYGSPSFEIEMGLDGYRWRDAGGRIELSAERHGQVCSVWIPPQPNLEHGFLDESQIFKLTGTIDGDPVEGMLVDDHVYALQGAPPLGGLTSKIEHYWIQWWIEYEDGGTEAGVAWRGFPGSGFAHAHQYVDGRSRARQDAKIDVARNENGSIETVTVALGSDVTFEFEQIGVYDWPLHTYGHVSSCSRDRKIVKSSCYLENWPLDWNLVDDYLVACQRLFGRPPSLKRVLEGARIEDDRIVLAPPDRVPART